MMKRFLICIASALSICAVAQPFYLCDKPHCSVNGVVISVNASQIVVSNFITVVQPSYQTRWVNVPLGRGRFRWASVTEQSGSTQRDMPVYWYVKSYAQWAQVRVGDRMQLNQDDCYLMSDLGQWKTVEWYEALKTKRSLKIWH